MVLLPLLCLLARASSYSSGAPPATCASLTPGHGGQPGALADSPYLLEVEGEEGVVEGEELLVTLRGAGFLTMQPFMGFLIQVREVEGGGVVGSWRVGEGEVAYLSCGSLQDTATHSSPGEKTAVTVAWVPDIGQRGQVYVTASVVKDFSNYWVGLRSKNIRVKAKPELEPEAEAEPEPEPEPSAEAGEQKSLHEVYLGCSSTKSCFGVPAGCEAAGGCRALAAWKMEREEMQIELYSSTAVGGYAALGLSQDPRMGEDLVILCAEAGGKVSLGLGWNSGRQHRRLEPDQGLELLEGRVEDGTSLYCKIKRSNSFQGRAGDTQYTFDLAKEPYHLLVASGRYSSTPSYHGPGMALPSSQKVDMTRVTRVGGRGDLFFKLHGMLMVVAWLGCAGSGMLLARYKTGAAARSRVNVATQWHRLLMVTVWAVSIAGVALVAVELGGWPYDQSFIMQNPHPVLGSAALILTFIQPFIALARPHPEASSRWIFNWTHWFIGNSAHVIAIMAMFFAIELEKARLERVVTWVLVTYVVFHVTSHLVLSINVCWSETPPATAVHPLAGRFGSMGDDLHMGKDKRGGSCRKVCFVTYFLVTWSIAALIVTLIMFDPKLLQAAYNLNTI